MQVRQVEQELGIFDAHKVALFVQAGAGNQAMNVRMELQTLVPGVEDGGEAADSGAQRFVAGQFFAESAHHGGEEQVIGLFGMRAEEAAP